MSVTPLTEESLWSRQMSEARRAQRCRGWYRRKEFYPNAVSGFVQVQLSEAFHNCSNDTHTPLLALQRRLGPDGARASSHLRRGYRRFYTSRCSVRTKVTGPA